jgi:UDP-2-acetamido-3-amino-2,3-dideoxy-glucuronate N-acetyltransferase
VFIHNLSDVQSKNIGTGTTIWQYCVILKGASIGKNCNICSHCFIENNVVIGDHVTIKNGVYLYDSVIVEDYVFIGPNVTFTNDIYPRSSRAENKQKKNYPKTVVQQGSSIGAGSLILPGIVIGKGAIIGAGSVITKNVDQSTTVHDYRSKIIKNIKDK